MTGGQRDRRCHRFGAGPSASGTDSARPFLRGRVPLPTPDGRRKKFLTALTGVTVVVSALDEPSRKGLLDRERPQARVGWPCTSQPPPWPCEACRTPGSLPSTARRPGSAPAIRGPWPNPKPSGDLRNPRSARFGAISLHKHPDVVFAPPDRQRASAERRSNPDSRKADRTPYRMAVDRASGTRRPEQFPHLGDPAEAGLKAAHFRNRLVVHAEDGARPQPTGHPPSAPPRASGAGPATNGAAVAVSQPGPASDLLSGEEGALTGAPIP